MRVLWICNIMPPSLAIRFGQKINNKEGWIAGLMGAVLAYNAAALDEVIQLGVAFPIGKEKAFLKTTLIVTEDYDIPFYGFREDTLAAEHYDKAIETDMTELMEDFKPDIIHCFGTEYPHTLAAVKCFGKPERTLIGIQGLCRVYAGCYMANLPKKVQSGVTFRDIVRKDTLLLQQQKFEGRGQWELAAVQGAGHITGRTHWDRYWTAKWNPKAQYHAMNETLREEFYSGGWSLEQCQRHRLFLSQGDYPIKGLHYMLLAMPEILARYPDTEVYVAGNSLLRGKGIGARLKISRYGAYLEQLIKTYHLEKKVHFLGQLEAEEMKNQYLKSHAFVCPSSIENSPNSLGEAMILGVPVITADVGGIKTMLTEEEGFIFEGFRQEKAEDEEELFKLSRRLADTVCRAFSEEADMLKRAERARVHALQTHDGMVNGKRLLEIYKEMMENTL